MSNLYSCEFLSVLSYCPELHVYSIFVVDNEEHIKIGELAHDGPICSGGKLLHLLKK